MKKSIFLLLATMAVGVAAAQNFRVTLAAPQYKSGIAYLTYRMGPNLNVEDSAAVNNKGTAVFTAKRRLPGGIYAIVLPGKRLIRDFFIGKEQIISIKINDTNKLVEKTIITGSKENLLYELYQKNISAKGRQMEEERKLYAAATNKADSLIHENNFNSISKQMNDYRDLLIKNNPKSMLASLLLAMKEPSVPIKRPITHQDSLDNYYYFKSHYWDGVTFMDERVIRTPFFMPKLERYYREILPQVADSIIRDVDYRLLLARTCPEMYKLLLNWLTDEYINPKYMGQDAVFVHLFEKYHSKGLTNWLNEKQMETISRRAYMVMSNLVGEKAANLEMIDSTGKPTPLYSVNADYTLVVFWDPNCGHCKTEVPRVDSFYQAEWKKHNLKVYAVLSQDDKNAKITDWVNFIKEHKLGEWVHVYETKQMEEAGLAADKPGYRQLYDVTITPTIFLLDNEKRIIAKKLTLEQINDLLKVKWKTN
jgi:thiol-disulfide isomerase/thioredoxin